MKSMFPAWYTLLAVCLVLGGCGNAPSPAEPVSVPVDGDDGKAGDAGVGLAEPVFTQVYFFHRTIRCHECMSMELLTEMLLRKEFIEEHDAGVLAHAVYNLDDPENEHFAEDFELTFSSLVFADIAADGEVVRWKELEDAWEKSVDPDAFEHYVAEELKYWLQAKSQ